MKVLVTESAGHPGEALVRFLKEKGRVYDNNHAREKLGWEPQYTYSKSIKKLIQGSDYRSELTKTVGSKGYHDQIFNDGPYPASSF